MALRKANFKLEGTLPTTGPDGVVTGLTVQWSFDVVDDSVDVSVPAPVVSGQPPAPRAPVYLVVSHATRFANTWGQLSAAQQAGVQDTVATILQVIRSM